MDVTVVPYHLRSVLVGYDTTYNGRLRARYVTKRVYHQNDEFRAQLVGFYRQVTPGTTVTLIGKLSMRDGQLTLDDGALRPTRLRF